MFSLLEIQGVSNMYDGVVVLFVGSKFFLTY